MYDQAQIMRNAWAIVRKANVAKFGFRVIMARALKRAWADAKFELALQARRAAAEPPAARVLEQIADLEQKDRWTAADKARRAQLGAELMAA